MSDLPHLLAVARGQQPADLLLRNGRIINVFSGEIEPADIAICADRIAGIGAGYQAAQSIDVRGAYVAPGLIDAHVHIESSLCLPAEFARAVVPRGVTTAVTDPHEIANVAGIEGIRFMSDAARGLPLRVIIMAPSCVPATSMATSGASLDFQDLALLLKEGIVHGLAEVMNFPGVIGGDPEMLRRIEAFEDHPRDGHAPLVRGQALNAYVASGIGSDHECVSVEEAREKLARGLWILIREATNAHNLAKLLPLVTTANSRRICFCTDDRQPADLLGQGSVDHMLREAIRFGIDPIEAFRMCTVNPCEWLGLHDRGAISPGRVADLMVFDDLSAPVARQVFSGGQLVAENGAMIESLSFPAARWSGTNASINWAEVNLAIKARSGRIRVIRAVADQLTTEHHIADAVGSDGCAVADVGQDILKMAVIERHGRKNNVGLGFIQGFGLKRGAIAGTVAHDHHNLVVIGCDDASMRAAAEATGAGLAAADGVTVLGRLPLPVAGLMSDRPIEEVRVQYDALVGAARSLGSALHDPFMAMSFMALEVIPKLKLTDQGLVDVEDFCFVDLFV